MKLFIHLAVALGVAWLAARYLQSQDESAQKAIKARDKAKAGGSN